MKRISLFVFLIVMLTCKFGVAEMLVDQLDPLERRYSVLATVSQIGSSELVSYFQLDQNAALSQLVWSGLLQNRDRIGLLSAATPALAGEVFVIRLYETLDGQPSFYPIQEFAVRAKGDMFGASLIGSVVFTADLIDDVELPAGTYWISFSYAATDGKTFWQSIEPGAEGGITGSGGAVRSNGGPEWQPVNEGVSFLECRGFSMQISGEYFDNETDSGIADLNIIKGSIGHCGPGTKQIAGGEDSEDVMVMLFAASLKNTLSINTQGLTGSEEAFLSVPDSKDVLFRIKRCFSLGELVGFAGKDFLTDEDDRLLLPVSVLSEEDSESITSQLISPTDNGTFQMLDPWSNGVIEIENIDYMKFKDTPMIRVVLED
ncbi:MAG: hypothetical protein GY850_23760 [bacterium]|nr:hypothetical protein [bacterium]